MRQYKVREMNWLVLKYTTLGVGVPYIIWLILDRLSAILQNPLLRFIVFILLWFCLMLCMKPWLFSMIIKWSDILGIDEQAHENKIAPPKFLQTGFFGDGKNGKDIAEVHKYKKKNKVEVDAISKLSVRYVCEVCGRERTGSISFTKTIPAGNNLRVNNSIETDDLLKNEQISNAAIVGKAENNKTQNKLIRRIENAIKYDADISAICPRCNIEQSWASMIEKAIETKSSLPPIFIMYTTVIFALFIFTVNSTPRLSFIMTNFSLHPLLVPIIPIFSALLLYIISYYTVRYTYIFLIRKKIYRAGNVKQVSIITNTDLCFEELNNYPDKVKIRIDWDDVKTIFTNYNYKSQVNPSEPICCIFQYPTADEAKKNFDFDIIDYAGVINYQYGWGERTQRLVQCKNCGNYFLYEESRFFGINNKNCEKISCAFYPVKSPEEALAYSKYEGVELKNIYKGQFLEIENRQWRWNKLTC